MSIRELWERMKANPRYGPFIMRNETIIKTIAVVAAAAAVAAILLISNRTEGEEVTADNQSIVSEETVADTVYVDIGGEVKSPKVVELNDGSRVEDAIEAAGGLTDKADIRDINRAAFVNDGDKIYIPSVDSEDAAGGGSAGMAAVQNSTGKVNINTADSEELQTITGVGPVTAEKIISYRESNGRFSRIEDIKNVSGIGDKTFEKMKDSITT